jgi:hypothetical protein
MAPTRHRTDVTDDGRKAMPLHRGRVSNFHSLPNSCDQICVLADSTVCGHLCSPRKDKAVSSLPFVRDLIALSSLELTVPVGLDIVRVRCL